MTITIEAATDDDLEPMADLLAELFTLESDFKPDRNKQLTGLYLILENPAVGRLFVLRIDGRVVGMANALFTVSTAEGRRVILLEDVIVSPSYRGQGLGSRLVEHILSWAVSEGIPRVTLLSDKANTKAIRFYQRLGFDFSAMRVLRFHHGTAHKA